MQCGRKSESPRIIARGIMGQVFAPDAPICNDTGSRGDWRPSSWRLPPSEDQNLRSKSLQPIYLSRYVLLESFL